MDDRKSVEQIIRCRNCRHCFGSNRSETGYACEVWGYDDYADGTTLDGYCHKAKSLYPSQAQHETWRKSK